LSIECAVQTPRAGSQINFFSMFMVEALGLFSLPNQWASV